MYKRFTVSEKLIKAFGIHGDWWQADVLQLTLVPASTLIPFADSCCTTRLPVLPVAPATNTCTEAHVVCSMTGVQDDQCVCLWGGPSLFCLPGPGLD